MPSKNSNNSWETRPTPDEPDAKPDRFDQELVAYHENLVAGKGNTDEPTKELSPEDFSRLNKARAVLNLLEEDRRKSDSQGESEISAALPSLSPAGGDTFGRFKILGEIGSGGHGIVFLAWDPRLSREVALKLPRPEVLLTPGLRKRFLHEAHLMAGFNHPGILPVFEVGEVGPVWYITSRYCRGKSLAAWLRKNPNPVPFRAAAELVASIAEAIHHTHSRGVLHRDLKPENILLEPSEAPTQDSPNPGHWAESWGKPLVCDFGLARPVETSDRFTNAGAILGTPAYMAPEQAEGRNEAIGTGADIWSLGVILYECLTGFPPFGTGSDRALLKRISEEAPPSLHSKRPDVPRDLETICLKCLEKDPPKRYVSAAHLAEDLQRWLKGEPIRARRHNLAEQVALWARREPVMAMGSALLGLLLILLLGGGIWFLLHRAETLAQVTLEGERRREAEERAETRQFLNGVITVNSREARRKPSWTWENLRDVKSLAPLATTAETQATLRSEAMAALSAPDIRLGKKIVEGFLAYKLAYHPAGSWLALAQAVSDDDESKPMQVLLVDPRSGDVQRRLLFPSNTEWIRKNNRAESTSAMAVSPDGRYLVVGTRSGWLHIWDLQGKENTSLSWQASPSIVIDQVAFAPDGLSFFTLDRAGNGFRWKAGVREASLPIFGIGKVEYIVPNSPPGTLYLQSLNCLVRFSLDNPEIPTLGDYFLEARSEAPKSPSNWCRAVAPGQSVGVQERENNLWLFETSTGQLIQQLPQSEGERGNTTVAFSPDGQLIARNSPNGLQLWETTSGRLVGRLNIPLGRFAMAIHPDGKTVAVNSNEGTYLCEIGGSEEHVTLPPLGFQFHLQAMSFNDSGEALMVLWEQQGPERLGSVGHHFELQKLDVHAAYPPSNPNRLGILGQIGNFMSLTPRPRDGIVAMLPNAVVNWSGQARSDPVLSKSLAKKEGRSLVTDSQGGAWLVNAYELWHNPRPGEESGWTSFWKSDREIFGAGIDFTRIVVGTRWAVAGRRDGACLVFDAQTRKHIHTWNACDSRIECLALHPDEDRILVGSARGNVVVHALPEGQLLKTLPSHDDKVSGLAFLQDSVIVSAGFDGEMRFLTVDGTLLFTWNTPMGIEDLQLSPDGSTLAIYVDKENSLRLWRLDRLIQRLEKLGLSLPLAPGISRPLRHAPEDSDRQVLRAPRPTSPHGLKVEWYQGIRFDRKLRESYVPKLDDAWGMAPGLPEYSVRYSGWVEPPGPGKYRLILESNGRRFRLRVDRTILGDSFWNPSPIGQAKVLETSGMPWLIQVEGSGDGNPGYFRLLWQAEGQKEPTVVPESAFYHDYRDTNWHKQGKKW